MENSSIEWTDHTFNPWIGCQHVSPGCDHCYAEVYNTRYKWNGGEWGPKAPRKRTSDVNWCKPLSWNSKAEIANRAAKRKGRAIVRPKVFCASMADWLDNKAPNEWRSDLADLIVRTPNLDWLLLTKRIENYEKRAPWKATEIPSNVWLGVTAEDQEHYEGRWPILSSFPATAHFISYEPALGSLSLLATSAGSLPDWVICGGENGPHARHMKPRWARRLAKECDELGIAFFMKQMTKKQPIPEELLIREFPTDPAFAR